MAIDNARRWLPRGTTIVAAAGSFVLIVAGVATPTLLDHQRGKEARQLLNGLNFESTDGAPSWWTTVLLLLLALLAFLNGRASAGLDHPGDAVRWRVLAGVLVWSSFDHDTQVHVAVSRLVGGLAGLPDRLDPLAVGLGVVAVCAWIPMLARATWSVRIWAITGASLLLAGGWAVDVANTSGASAGVASQAAESGLVWAGLIVLMEVLERMRPVDSDVTGASRVRQEPLRR